MWFCKCHPCDSWWHFSTKLTIWRTLKPSAHSLPFHVPFLTDRFSLSLHSNRVLRVSPTCQHVTNYQKPKKKNTALLIHVSSTIFPPTFRPLYLAHTVSFVRASVALCQQEVCMTDEVPSILSHTNTHHSFYLFLSFHHSVSLTHSNALTALFTVFCLLMFSILPYSSKLTNTKSWKSVKK